MNDFGAMGRMLVIAGLALLVIGGLMMLGGRVPGLGRLPGDFTFEGRGWKVFLPLGTSLLISLVLTLVLWLLRRR